MFLVSSHSCLCPIQWRHLLSREWRCSWSSADRRCSNCIWVIDNFIVYKGAIYIRDLTVIGTTILVHYLEVKSLQLIWRPGNFRYHIRIPDLQIRGSELTSNKVHQYEFINDRQGVTTHSCHWHKTCYTINTTNTSQSGFDLINAL